MATHRGHQSVAAPRRHHRKLMIRMQVERGVHHGANPLGAEHRSQVSMGSKRPTGTVIHSRHHPCPHPSCTGTPDGSSPPEQSRAGGPQHR